MLGYSAKQDGGRFAPQLFLLPSQIFRGKSKLLQLLLALQMMTRVHLARVLSSVDLTTILVPGATVDFQ
jgi:hypothetical protein